MHVFIDYEDLWKECLNKNSININRMILMKRKFKTVEVINSTNINNSNNNLSS